MQKIVIVGGGAGGLELASRLSRTLGRKKQAEITLVDRSRTHIWKPLLHEVAAGVIDKHSDAKYAERADFTSFTGPRYFPGRPRNFMLSATFAL